MPADFTSAMQIDGRELLVTVVKGTFTLPPDGGQAELAEDQAPLVTCDAFTGEPGLSAPLYEIDFAPVKQRCDALLNGSAYAPRGAAKERVPVRLRVGAVAKGFDVVGNRTWEAGLVGTVATDPEPFEVMPLSYDVAFGGVDHPPDESGTEHWYPLNHAGVGYHRYLQAGHIAGKALPNTEQTDKPINKPDGNYLPMAFGAFGRAWKPRVGFAGTYDQNWIDNIRPFFPADFSDRYYQAAPSDQQTDHLRGGEPVELRNLTPGGLVRFQLPKIRPSIELTRRDGSRVATSPPIDTVLLEPDLERFTLTWRVATPLDKNVFDIRTVTVSRLT